MCSEHDMFYQFCLSERHIVVLYLNKYTYSYIVKLLPASSGGIT